MGTVTRREWVWAGLFAALVMALTCVPYLVALSAQTEQLRFSGFLIGVEDGYSYIAKMGQGARGQWLFTLPYTSEPQQGVILFVFYLLLGKLSGPGYTAQVLTFHLARLVFGIALLLVSYRLLAEFLLRVRQRRLGLVLIALGGGLGWLLLLLNQPDAFGSLPLELSLPEAYSFVTLYSLPHLAAARTFSLLALLAHLHRRGVLAGLMLFVVSFIQPIHVLVMWAVLGADALLSWRLSRSDWAALRRAALSVVISAPLIVYTIFTFSADPLYREMNAQNILYSPHPFHYLLGYGLWLLPAALGWRALHHRLPRLARFAAGWIVVTLVLVYLPVTFQRRLIEVVQVPLVILTVWGLTVILRRAARWLTPLVLAASLLTSGFILGTGSLIALARPEGAFLPASQRVAFDWLARHAPPGAVALSAYATGNALPAYTPLTAYIGLSAETAALAQKRARVAAFYQSGTEDGVRQSLLREGRIRYVLLGPSERALGDFDPAAADYLTLRFVSGEFSVYEVTP